MIFGKEYDVALSIILKCDRKNSEKLIKLLSELPVDLIRQIRFATKLLDSRGEYKNLTDEERKLMSGLTEGDNGEYFTFGINKFTGSLSIAKDRVTDKNNGYSPLYEITLMRMNYIENLEFFEDKFIANIEIEIVMKDCHRTCYMGSNATAVSVLSEEMEYNIIKTPLGWFINSSVCDSNDKTRTRINMVNFKKINDMQEQLCLEKLTEDFLSKRRIKK